jgi:hypothetical protein
MDRRRYHLPFAVFCAALCGCGASSSLLRQTPPMELHLDEKEMKAEVLNHVAVGTSIDEAKKVMEAHGFKCCYDRDWWGEQWVDADPAKRGEIYLICSKYTPQRSWWDSLFLSDEIKVYFSFKDGKVSELRVKHIPCCA